VVIAEGARCGVRELMQYYEAQGESIGFDLRVTRLGHVVRGGAPGAADRVLATRLGTPRWSASRAARAACWSAACAARSPPRRSARFAGRTRPANAELLELARVMAM
jgi:6-phosphofructokinase 1